MPAENRILEELAALRADTLATALRELSSDARTAQLSTVAQQADIKAALGAIQHDVAEIRADMRASSSGAGSLQSKLADAFITSDWRGRAVFMAVPALCLILTAAWLSGESLAGILSAGATLIHGPANQPTETNHAAP